MRALTVSEDPEQSWDDLVRFWEQMEWPEGSKILPKPFDLTLETGEFPAP